MFISISAENSRFLQLGVVYHLPKLGYLALFQAEFERLHPSYPIAVIISDFNVDLNRTSHDSDSLIIDFCICDHLFICTCLLRTFPYHLSHCIFSHLHRSLLSDHAFGKSFHQQPFSFLSTHDHRDHLWFLCLSPFSSYYHCSQLFPLRFWVPALSHFSIGLQSIDRLLSMGKLKFSIIISLRLAMLLSGPSELEDPLLLGLMRQFSHA